MSGKKKVLTLDEHQIHKPQLADDVFNLANFVKNFQIKINSISQDSMQMDLIGIDAAFANALRRIIIAQIPTMAFHKVLLYQNTSVLPDELLVHRLGLLPLKIDSDLFQYRKDDQQLSSQNSLKFQLKAKCTRKKEYANLKQQELEKKNIRPEEYLQNAVVYSRQLKWIPQGNQKQKLNGKVSIVHDKIVVAKLRQNQQINLQIYAQKGIGRKHTKWSPVSTAFYRLMPQISLNQQFNHTNNAQILIKACPAGVFEVKKGKAIASKPRNCTTCRQCIKLKGVELQKVCDHFIFTIETTGIYSPDQIFLKALQILEEKAKSYAI